MNTYENGIDSEDVEFEYEVGSVITKVAWYQPTNYIVNKLIKTIKKIKNFEKYELFLVGGVVNGRIGETWDVDIIVSGEIIPKEFEDFLHEIYDIALNKFNILVDVRWYSVPIWYSNHLMETNETDKVKTIRFGYYRKKIEEHESIINLFEKGKKISQHLVELDITIPNKKTINTKVTPKYVKI
jgi:predicted nucleotidyltransferase